MKALHDPSLTQPDIAVWNNLMHDLDQVRLVQQKVDSLSDHDDQLTLRVLDNLNDPKSQDFQPTICTGWDHSHISPFVQRHIIQPYCTWAKTVVRRPTDVVFLTHLLLYFSTSIPSAVGLYLHFTWPHAVLHWLMQAYYAGSFTLMLHNHIHNNGVLAAEYVHWDKIWPYILEPLMGHTWDSYYYHHVKHHHVENNGPGDLSSTIRFQRDELYDFLIYVGRFILLVWIELPLYFFHKNKNSLAIRTAISELSSYAMIYMLARSHFRATLFVLIIPLLQMRIAMMVGNWGQHALVDEAEPDSDFRSSITLIDVAVSELFLFCAPYYSARYV